MKLRAGERLDLRMECGFKKGEAAIALNHDTPGLDRRAVLPEFLHPEPGPKRKLEIPVEKRPDVIADFGFEEKDGALSRSRAGVEIFGRLTGNARRVPGTFGSGIEFAPKGEFAPALFPIDEELRLPNTNYTVAFWFKTSTPNVHLCAAKSDSGYNNQWADHVVQLEGGKLQFRLQDDQPIETPGPLNDGEWHHVVTTVGEGGQRLHVDGNLIGTGKLTRRTRSSNRLGLDLGPGSGGGAVVMDEIRILSRALTTVEVEAFSSHK